MYRRDAEQNYTQKLEEKETELRNKLREHAISIDSTSTTINTHQEEKEILSARLDDYLKINHSLSQKVIDCENQIRANEQEIASVEMAKNTKITQLENEIYLLKGEHQKLL